MPKRKWEYVIRCDSCHGVAGTTVIGTKMLHDIWLCKRCYTHLSAVVSRHYVGADDGDSYEEFNEKFTKVTIKEIEGIPDIKLRRAANTVKHGPHSIEDRRHFMVHLETQDA